MQRGSWTHAPARMTVGLAVAFAAFLVLKMAAADAPAPTPSEPPAASPTAAPSPADAPPPDGAPRPESPPAAAPPSTASPSATELDGPSPRAQAGTGGSTQSGMAGCAVWTDRCVICQRDSGVIACSNIGVACQPQPLMCLRQDAAPEKKPEN
jgi:hypothetical protein